MDSSNSQQQNTITENLTNLLLLLQEGLISLDSSGRITSIHEVGKLLGFDQAELLGKHYSELY
jgi:hypothetical protein